MAASEEQINAAAQAVEQGMQTATAYWQAAAQNPGVGAEIRLPSYPIASIGRPVTGLSYDTPGELAPAPGRPHIKLVPDYASDIVGGAIHQANRPGAPAGMDGVAWPAGQTQPSSVASRTSSVQYVPAHALQQTWRSRLRAALDVLLGR